MGRVKNPDDARYRKNHRRLFASLNKTLSSNYSLSIRPVDLYSRANLHKTTFFRHFRSVDHTFRTESAELHAAFCEELTRLFGQPSPRTSNPPTSQSTPATPTSPTPAAQPAPPNPIPIQQFFTFFSIFILRHRGFFAATLNHHYHRPLRQLLWQSRPYLTSTWPTTNPALGARLYELYILNLTPVLTDWKNKNFSKHQLDHVISEFVASSNLFYKNLGVFRSLAEITVQSPKPPKA